MPKTSDPFGGFSPTAKRRAFVYTNGLCSSKITFTSCELSVSFLFFELSPIITVFGHCSINPYRLNMKKRKQLCPTTTIKNRGKVRHAVSEVSSNSPSGERSMPSKTLLFIVVTVGGNLKMAKTVLVFVLSSIVKGLILFTSVFIGDFFPESNLMLRFIASLVLMGLVDWFALGQVKSLLGGPNYFKSFTFGYLTFVGTLWIPGPLFQLYNSLTEKVVEGQPEMPTSALMVYLVFGLITTLISTATWTKKNKKLPPTKPKAN